MANNKVILEATLIDGVSNKVKHIVNTMKSVELSPGMKSTAQWMDHMGVHAKNFTQEGLKALDVIGGFGLSGLAAASGLAEMTERMKEFGQSRAEMANLARQMEINVDVLNRWEKAGQHFTGVTGDAMANMMKEMSEKLFDFQNRWNMSDLWKNLDSEGLADLIPKLKKDGYDVAKVIEDIFKRVDEVSGKDAIKRKKLLEEILPGSADTAERLFGDSKGNGFQGFLDQLKTVQKEMDKSNSKWPEMMEKFRDAQRDFNISLENFENKVGPAFIDKITAVIKEAQDFLDVLNDTKGKKEQPFRKDESWGGAAADAYKWSDKLENKFFQWFDSNVPITEFSPDKLAPDGYQAPIAPRGLRQGLHKSSYDGSDYGNLLQRTSYDDDVFSVLTGNRGKTAHTSPITLQTIIEAGTAKGVIDAFRQLGMEGGGGGAGGRGGLINASYEAGLGSFDNGADPYGRGGSGGGGGGGGDDGGGGGDTGHPGIGLGKMGKGNGRGYSNFDAKAPAILGALMKKYDLTKEQAAGIVGNLGHESARFTAYHEGGQAANRGGVGWAQWTGRRRRQFEAFAAKNHLNPTSDEASWRFLTEGDPEIGKAIAAVKRTHDVKSAMMAFEQSFERAGVKSYGSREALAERALHLGATAPTVAGSPDTAAKVTGAQDGAMNRGAEAAVDNATKLLGLSDREVAKRLGSKMTPGEWCADFVNGALHSAGVKGTNSSMAQSFANWGREVALKAVKKGDVIVDGEPAGHVSLATGNTRTKNGHLQIETMNGNWGHSRGQSRVMRDWLTAESWVHARRATGLRSEPPVDTAKSNQIVGRTHVQVDVNHDGTVKRSRIRSEGMVTASMNNVPRFPTMRTPTDVV